MRIRRRVGAAAPWTSRVRTPALLALLLAGATVTRAADGDLDPSFGAGGAVVESFGAVATGAALALQPDGRIVVVGSLRSAAQPLAGAMLVARYTTGGELDASFNGTGYALSADELFGAAGVAAAVQADGRIVALAATGAGTRYLAGYAARYENDGSVDSGFGSGGRQPLGLQPVDVVSIAGDQLMVAGVQVTAQLTTEARLLRLRPDGTADPAFGVGGQAALGLAIGGPRLGVAPDGRLVATLRTVTNVSPLVFHLVVRRLLADGSADASFGAAGSGLVDLGVDAYPAGLVALADGRTLLAYGGAGPRKLVRLAADGTVDASFGDGGTTVATFATAMSDLRLLPDERLLLIGGGPQQALARLLGDGAPDPTFGSEGVVTGGFGDAESAATDIAFQSDGKLLAVGSTGGFDAARLTLTRHLMPAPPAECAAAVDAVRLRLRAVSATDSSVRLQAQVQPSGGAEVDPLATGLRLRLRDATGATLDVDVPAGAYQAATRSGWRVRTRGARTTWRFRGAAGPMGESVRVLRAVDGTLHVAITGARGALHLASVALPLTARVDLAPPAQAGACGAMVLDATHCRWSSAGATLSCRG
ncbi:MAG: hypothetical protein SF182_05400 [Deltaproteobacteria bacterium]|nr:hypothetical protein [Deltaproteobacteria bacterium]